MFNERVKRITWGENYARLNYPNFIQISKLHAHACMHVIAYPHNFYHVVNTVIFVCLEGRDYFGKQERTGLSSLSKHRV